MYNLTTYNHRYVTQGKPGFELHPGSGGIIPGVFLLLQLIRTPFIYFKSIEELTVS